MAMIEPTARQELCFRLLNRWDLAAGQTLRVREWLVAGALIARSAIDGYNSAPDSPSQRELLLVCNRRRSGDTDWTPPGGVIDPGELLVDGLTREVREETGLEVVAWDGPAYTVLAEAPGLGWRLRVEVHLATEVTGTLLVGDDPDGIVVDAEFFGVERCAEILDSTHRWVREPLLDWLDALPSFPLPIMGSLQSDSVHRYSVHGDDPATATVERVT